MVPAVFKYLTRLSSWNLRSAAFVSLLNRRAFDEGLERAVAQAARADKPLSLLMLDLDNFKRLNDTHGHISATPHFKPRPGRSGTRCAGRPGRALRR